MRLAVPTRDRRPRRRACSPAAAVVCERLERGERRAAPRAGATERPGRRPRRELRPRRGRRRSAARDRRLLRAARRVLDRLAAATPPARRRRRLAHRLRGRLLPLPQRRAPTAASRSAAPGRAASIAFIVRTRCGSAGARPPRSGAVGSKKRASQQQRRDAGVDEGDRDREQEDAGDEDRRGALAFAVRRLVDVEVSPPRRASAAISRPTRTTPARLTA